jgi:hypothetical protein
MINFHTLYTIRVPFPDDIKYTFYKNQSGELILYTSKEKAFDIAKRYPDSQVISIRIHDWY